MSRANRSRAVPTRRRRGSADQLPAEDPSGDGRANGSSGNTIRTALEPSERENAPPIKLPDEPTLSFNGLLRQFANDPSSHTDHRRSPRHLRPVSASGRRSGPDHAPEQPESPPASTSSQSPRKKRKPARGYAPPERYAHLSPVRDSIAGGLICIFVGLNPGIATAVAGHAFAGPTNLFWPLMFESGCVGRRLTYRDDGSLPSEWRLGITNLVDRPTAEQSELSREELVANAGRLEVRLAEHFPGAVCIVGKGIWESIHRFKTGKPLKSADFSFGWQDPPFAFAQSEHGQPRVFVVPSTSGRVAAYSREMKATLWRELGVYVKAVRERERQQGRAESSIKTEPSSGKTEPSSGLTVKSGTAGSQSPGPALPDVAIKHETTES
ncbi:uracil-DNA glycosylase-like protein [Dipodascopsis tothii]|uniref:uracil-DNA glycosylase-like protein n=1 Tax=Dipodascopsis tothii TaxID=44089 RepID=UPI0034CD4966